MKTNRSKKYSKFDYKYSRSFQILSTPDIAVITITPQKASKKLMNLVIEIIQKNLETIPVVVFIESVKFYPVTDITMIAL